MRIWAFILILICTLNTFSVSIESLFSESPNPSKSSISSILVSDARVIDVSVIEADHSDSEHDDGDCHQHRSACKQCHLGHCNFILSSLFKNLFPDFTASLQNTEELTFLGISLSGPRRPPRV